MSQGGDGVKKRVAAAVLILILSMVSAGSFAEVCLTLPGFALLADDQGDELIPAGLYEDIFTVREGALYAAGGGGEYRLFDAAGRMLSEDRFAMIRDAGDCLIYRQGDRFGAMDAGGEALLEPVWTQLVSDGEGGFLALNGDPLDDQPDELLHIEAGGGARTTGAHVLGGLADVADGRMPFMGADGRYGAVDAEGNVAIEPVWRYIGPFAGALAVAQGESGRGVIDAEGDVVVPTEYAWLDRSDAMIAGLKDDGTVDVYAPDGASLAFTLEGRQASLVGAHIAVSDDDGARLYDAGGRLVCAASAEAAFYPALNGQVIVADGPWGQPCQRLIDADGQAASEGFQQLLPLTGDRYGWLSMVGVVYYSDDLGGIQTSWNYDSARWGLMDGKGNRLTDAVYAQIRPLSDERLLLVTADEAILADMDGEPIRRWTLNAAAVSSSEGAS